MPKLRSVRPWFVSIPAGKRFVESRYWQWWRHDNDPRRLALVAYYDLPFWRRWVTRNPAWAFPRSQRRAEIAEARIRSIGRKAERMFGIVLDAIVHHATRSTGARDG